MITIISLHILVKTCRLLQASLLPPLHSPFISHKTPACSNSRNLVQSTSLVAATRSLPMKTREYTASTCCRQHSLLLLAPKFIDQKKRKWPPWPATSSPTCIPRTPLAAPRPLQVLSNKSTSSRACRQHHEELQPGLKIKQDPAKGTD